MSFTKCTSSSTRVSERCRTTDRPTIEKQLAYAQVNSVKEDFDAALEQYLGSLKKAAAEAAKQAKLVPAEAGVASATCPLVADETATPPPTDTP